jgi:phosphomannomutase / phosphoglucomutase
MGDPLFPDLTFRVRLYAMNHSPIDPKIFRAYDIRGRAYEQLTTDACRLIGQAFGTELRERYEKEHPTVAVGRDARTHGPEFQQAVIQGLMEAGCIVIDIGQTPSPVNYFTLCTQDLDGGVQVTASHNPAHDNGLKLSVRHAHAYAGEELQHLRRRIENANMIFGEGELRAFDAITPYIEYLASLFEGAGIGLRIAVDSGNGVAGPAYCRALRAVGAEVTELYTEPDGTFPNHPADPSKHSTLKDLQAAVVEHGLRAGLAFDGDGDRLGLVDETGTIRSADEILLLLAKDHLSRFPGAKVVFTVSNSGILFTEISKWGGKPVMCKVGHSFVEHVMLENGAMLGGEQSGHFFCGEDYFLYDDALAAALRLLAILREMNAPLSSLFEEFPKVHQAPERRPHVPDEHKGRVIEGVQTHFSRHHDVETMDGVRIDFGDGSWAGIRQSNTSPCISIVLEARSPERLREIEELVLGHLKEYPEIQWSDD